MWRVLDSNEEQCFATSCSMTVDRQQRNETKVGGSNMVALDVEEQRTKRALSLGQSQSAAETLARHVAVAFGRRAHANSNLQSFIHPIRMQQRFHQISNKYSTNLDRTIGKSTNMHSGRIQIILNKKKIEKRGIHSPCMPCRSLLTVEVDLERILQAACTTGVLFLIVHILAASKHFIINRIIMEHSYW